MVLLSQLFQEGFSVIEDPKDRAYLDKIFFFLQRFPKETLYSSFLIEYLFFKEASWADFGFKVDFAQPQSLTESNTWICFDRKGADIVEEPNFYIDARHATDAREVAKKWQEAFHKKPLPNKILSALKDLQNTQRKPHEQICYLGWMLSRSAAPLRVMLANIAQGNLIERLENFFPCSEKVKEPLRSISSLLTRASFLLDLPLEKNRSVGVECYVNRSLALQEQKQKWQEILQRLSLPYDILDHWTKPFVLQNTLFARYISHLKLTFQQDAALKIKIYLGICLVKTLNLS